MTTHQIDSNKYILQFGLDFDPDQFDKLNKDTKKIVLGLYNKRKVLHKDRAEIEKAMCIYEKIIYKKINELSNEIKKINDELEDFIEPLSSDSE